MADMMTQEVTRILNQTLYYPIAAVFVLNLIQRRYMDRGLAKRYGSLYVGILLLAIWGFTFLMIRFALSDIILIPFAVLCIALIAYFRKHVLPFRLSCRRCGARLGPGRILFYDSNLCSGCDEERADDSAGSG